MQNELCLTVLKHLEKDELFKSFTEYVKTENEQSYSIFLYFLFKKGAQDDFTAYITDKILYDENPFSISAASSQTISLYLKRAMKKDLRKIYDCIYSKKDSADYNTGIAHSIFFDDWGNDETIDNLQNFYSSHGYGKYINYRAFSHLNGELIPIENAPTVQLSDLKDYESEKKIISDNIENLLKGYPHSDMLLYGERGTGKSSTMHAMLNRYFPDGLRIIELSKENMLDLNIIKSKLSEIPLKFIIYIDDLSLNGGDERISSLKAALEGSMDGHATNTMIVATSNRRHIIDEKFSNRDDSVHSNDSLQEELSLSDRFGISVLFTTTTKPQYLSIITQLAADAELKTDKETLCALAERWALCKGGRSPRRAAQFIKFVYACEQKNQRIDF